MIITIDSNFYASPSTRLLGNYGETMSRSIAVCYPLVEGASLYKLRFLLPDLKSCYEADVTLGSMAVSGSLLAQTGKLSCQWIAAGINEQGEYTVVAKSNVFSLVVGESIESDSAEPVPTYEQAAEMFDNAVELQQKLEGTAEQIDEFLLEFDEVKEASQDATSKVEALENAISLTSTPPIVASAQGEAVGITDSSDRSLQGLIVYGKSTQNGTPTPDSPVEIESVENPVVTISGKNLLKNTATTQTVNGVTFTVNSDGSITAKGTATAQAGITINTSVPLVPGNYIVSDSVGDYTNYLTQVIVTAKGGTQSYYATGTKPNFSISEGDSVKVVVYIRANVTASNLIFQPMIRLASVSDSTYEPYKEGQSISVPYTLHGVGDVSDYVDFEKGVKVQRTHKFGVTDNFTVADYNALGTCARVQIQGINNYEAVSQTTAIPALCNILPWKISITLDEPHFYVNGKNIWAFVPIAELSTQDKAGAKKWLIDHNAEFLYALATPIETPLTDEQKAECSALMSYFPTTTATNDKGAGLKLSYIADTKTYVDNQFKMLFALISSN